MRRGLIAMLLVLSACGSQNDGPTTTLSFTEEGKELYDTYCAACHGAGGVGAPEGPSLLDPVYFADETDDSAYLIAITQGMQPAGNEWSGMPAIPAVSHSEIARITAYLRELQGAVGG